MPILNRALTRSAPRSAMRLASSCTVIASGTTTSRTCLVARAGLHVVALFLFAGAAQRGERAGAAVVLVDKRAGDGELAALAMLVAAAAARARRLGPAWARARGRRDGGSCALPLRLRLARRLRARPELGARRGLFLGALARRFFGGGFLGLAVFFGAAALFLVRRAARLFLAAARFFERGEARFLGLAQQLRLKLLAAERSRPAADGLRGAGAAGSGLGRGRGGSALRRRAWAPRPAGLRPAGRGCAAS